MSEESKTKKDHAGLFIPAGLFLGLGVGFALNNIPAGLFVGLGFGFLLFAAAEVLGRWLGR